MEVLYGQWQPEAWSLWTSHHKFWVSFIRCIPRPSLQFRDDGLKHIRTHPFPCLHFSHPASFWYNFILHSDLVFLSKKKKKKNRISEHERLFFVDVFWKVPSGFPVLTYYQCFASCCNPSVFTFLKASLGCRFWRLYSYLLQTSLEFYCEGFCYHPLQVFFFL